MTCYKPPSLRPPPPVLDRKPDLAPSPPGDAEGWAIYQEMLAHLAAAKPPVNEEARAIILANERLMFGQQRTIID